MYDKIHYKLKKKNKKNNNKIKLKKKKRCGLNPWVGKIPWREGMVTHSSILTWRNPWTELDGKQLSMHVGLLFKLASAFIL